MVTVTAIDRIAAPFPGARKATCRREFPVPRGLVAGGALVAVLLAPGLASAQAVRFVPGVGLSGTYSDNVGLLAGDQARSGWIADLTPSLRVDLNGARLRGYLDLGLHELRYSNQPGLDERQWIVHSQATLEAIEKWLFVDARVDTTQQALSATGAPVLPDQPSASGNRVQTTAVQVAPHVRGRLGEFATYQVRFNAAEVRTQGEEGIPDTRTGEWIARIRNPSPSARIGWAVDVNALTARNDEIGSLDDNRVRASAIYAVDDSLHATVSLGRESTDFSGPDRLDKTTMGAGVEWTPSARTQAAAVAERRFFGTGHSAFLSHRTARTAWRIDSRRDVVVLPGVLGSGTGTVGSLMSDLMTAAIPDPVARADAVRRQLTESGLSGTPSYGGLSLTSRPTVYRTLDASFAALGVTNTFTLGATRRDQRAVGVSLGVDGAILPTDNARQKGVGASWARRLSPLSTLTLTGSTLRTDSLEDAGADTRMDTLTLALTRRLGPRTLGTFGVRHVKFDSTSAAGGYRENAAFATVSYRF